MNLVVSAVRDESVGSQAKSTGRLGQQGSRAALVHPEAGNSFWPTPSPKSSVQSHHKTEILSLIEQSIESLAAIKSFINRDSSNCKFFLEEGALKQSAELLSHCKRILSE